MTAAKHWGHLQRISIICTPDPFNWLALIAPKLALIVAQCLSIHLSICLSATA